MIALTAYGIRKAYKKQQARKAHKEQLERENQDNTVAPDELRSVPTSSSSYRQSSNLRPANGGLVNYAHNSPPSLSHAETASSSRYSASLYSQKSYQDPLEEMRQYRAYIQRQSYDFGTDTNPPAYEFVVGQNLEATHPWKSGLNLPRRAPSPGARHVPQGPDRVIELDSSSESSRSMTQRVPLRLFHPRSPVTSDNNVTSPVTQLPADLLQHVVSPILDDQLPASLNEFVVEVPQPLRIRKSDEAERYELPADEVTVASAVEGEDHEEEHIREHARERGEEHTTDLERQQLKRARSESGSEIESEDNEEVIVRFNMADRTKRPYPKRVTVAD